MRVCQPALKTFLSGRPASAARADLITITTRFGDVFRWTTCDQPLTVATNTFGATGTGAPLVKRGSFSQSSTLTVDTIDVTVDGANGYVGTWYDGTSYYGLTVAAAASQGFLDGAAVQIEHIIMPTPGDVSLGSIGPIFIGSVTSIRPEGMAVVLKVGSKLTELSRQLPRFSLRAACGNVLYDANCGLSKATWTRAGVIGSVSTASATTVLTVSSGAVLANGSGFFDGGMLTFTSGYRTGQRVGVLYWVSGANQLTLSIQMPSLPSAGDSFTVYPGCDLSQSRCNGTFSNLNHFRGYPNIPDPNATPTVYP